MKLVNRHAVGPGTQGLAPDDRHASSKPPRHYSLERTLHYIRWKGPRGVHGQPLTRRHFLRPCCWLHICCAEDLWGTLSPIGTYSELKMKLLAALVVPLVGARVVRFEQQVPIVQKDVEETAAPAVGVHFTSSYATAAAKYQNGTTVDLVRVRCAGSCSHTLTDVCSGGSRCRLR